MVALHAIAISLVLAQCGHTLVLVITITRMLTLRIMTRGWPMLFMILSSLGWNSLLKSFSGPQCVFAMKQWRYPTNFRFSLQTLTFHYRH
jgi:hypothetical protein